MAHAIDERTQCCTGMGAELVLQQFGMAGESLESRRTGPSTSVQYHGMPACRSMPIIAAPNIMLTHAM